MFALDDIKKPSKRKIENRDCDIKEEQKIILRKTCRPIHTTINTTEHTDIPKKFFTP